MFIFELTGDIVGLGRKGDRVVVQDAGAWSQSVVHPTPFNPGRLLLHLTEGTLTPLTPGGEAALVRLAADSPQPPPARPGRPDRQRRA